MSCTNMSLVSAMIPLLGLCAVSATTAQDRDTKSTFVSLSRGVPGVLYQPVVPGEKSHLGILVMHSGGDYLRFSACTELSRRGYTVLCANTSTSKQVRIQTIGDLNGADGRPVSVEESQRPSTPP